MELNEAIRKRRSVRKYTDQPVSREQIQALLDAAVLAPSGSNAQPWTFVVLQGAAVVASHSASAKTALLESEGEKEWFQKYKEYISRPDFNMFHAAPALVIIYAKPQGFIAEYDCCLAAENLMLTAHDMGLGTCWIGFAQAYFNLPAVKAALKVPSDYVAVAPLVVGYPLEEKDPVAKYPPVVLNWVE